MLRKMLSMLLVMLMLLSISVTFVSAEDYSGAEAPIVPSYDEPSTADGVSSFDEAYTYLVSVIESAETINRNYYTDESFEVFFAALSEACFARINAAEDMFTAEELFNFASELEKAYNTLEGLIFGDANSDKNINVKDATEIQKYLADIIKLSEGRLLCSDVNRDDNNNIKDATYIQKYVAGIIEPKENSFLHQELYVIDLKLQLLELMEQGEELTAGKKFEKESYDKYLSAYDLAGSVYSDERSKSTDVKDAMKALNDAIEGLIPDDRIPDGPYSIDYTIAYEFRVGPHESGWENISLIVNSPQELQDVIDKLDYDYYDKNEDIFPEEYNDEFFEENAVIVSLYLVGAVNAVNGFFQ